MLRIPDALSLAAMRFVSQLLGRKVGGSTGTNFVGVLWLAEQMQRKDQKGALVTILCDGGERYAHNYYNPQWYSENSIDTIQADAAIMAASEGRERLNLEMASAR